MDINYTGCLAVSLYGILIQGCRHNGNPHHGLRLLTCPVKRGEEGRNVHASGEEGSQRASRETATLPLVTCTLLRLFCGFLCTLISLLSKLTINLHNAPSFSSLSLSLFLSFFLAQFESLLRNTFYDCRFIYIHIYIYIF